MVFVFLFELGMWLSWKTMKMTLSATYNTTRYFIYGRELSKEELERKMLLDRLNHMEEEFEVLKEARLTDTTYLDQTVKFIDEPEPEVAGHSTAL